MRCLKTKKRRTNEWMHLIVVIIKHVEWSVIKQNMMEGQFAVKQQLYLIRMSYIFPYATHGTDVDFQFTIIGKYPPPPPFIHEYTPHIII